LFACVDFRSGGHLAVLAAIALAAGNVWYVAHRYSVHQLVDLCSYWILKKKLCGYRKWLSEHIADSFRVEERLSNNLHVRSSQIIFLFVACEIALVFTCRSEDCSFLHHYACWIRLVTGAAMVVAILGQWVAFSVDVNIASDPKNFRKDKAQTT
jgi:hypothetical protein